MEYIYRVTRERKNPGYYQSAVEVKTRNKRSVKALLRVMYSIERSAFERCVEPSEKITMIERAPIGEWEEITTEEEVL